MTSVPQWVSGRVLYQLHSLGAVGAPPTNPGVDGVEQSGHGLRVLLGWLDHVAELGCGGVLLTPIFVSSTHGYDTVDPLRIDQRLGDEGDFTEFVEACHQRDLKVVLDGVFNHVGRDFGPFRDVLTNGRDSRFVDWFRLDFDADDGDGFGYRCFEGHRELVVLNHRSAAVLEWASTVANHWLDRGADGWRFDAAYAMPTEFLAALSSRIRSSHPDAFVFGEVIHGDYAGFSRASGLGSVTQYELHKAIWSSLNDANLFELAWALKRHPVVAGEFVPVTFAGNHDVTRLASQLNDPRLLGPALAVLFTVPGVPCVYYGDELGWRGVKEHRAGGDDAIRPALPATPDASDETARSALELHRSLIAFRTTRPWLTGAAIEVVEVRNQQISFKVSAGDDVLLTLLDLSGSDPSPPDGWQPVFVCPGVVICECVSDRSR